MVELRVSVIIPTHNRPEMIRQTVERLLHQDVASEEYEILVVDDGSTPPVELPSEWLEVNVRLLRTLGIERSAARNMGADHASGTVLIFLDDDIWVSETFLTVHWDAHQEWDRLLAVGAIRFPELEWQKPFVRFRQQLEDESVIPNRGLVSAKNFCAAGNMSIRRDLFNRLEGFDPQLNSSEDQDLALRHSEREGRIAYLPEAVGIHHDKALDIHSYCKRMEWGYREMVPFVRRYPDWPDNIHREKVNGLIHWGGEPLTQSIRKVVKMFLSIRPVTSCLLGMIRVLELWAPKTRTLDRFYRVMLGLHIFRGYRAGLREYRVG